ncbi:MAG TPA: type VI secretion system-associated FHA domain protein TagH [Luteitalea sp.]|nr:type VI secretion system-associated FHA domain protein TagH [Luteitalea sp.]
MSVTLEVVATGDAPPLAESRKVFGVAGGTIGRARHSDWVLPHNKVSSRHARVTYEHSVFYIEDTSTNGIYLNSPDNRLEKGRLHPLQAGDRLYIEPYEITVSISSDLQATRLRPMPVAPPAAPTPRYEPDPFAGLPALGAPPAPPPSVGPVSLSSVPHAEDEVDPLKLLGGGPSLPSSDSRPVPTARELDEGPLLGGHYQPPPVRMPPAVPAPPAAAPPASFIPENYDPLAPDTRSFPMADVPMRAEPPAPPDFDVDLPPSPPPVPPPGFPSPAPSGPVGHGAEDEWLPSAVPGLPLMDALPPAPAAEAFDPRPTPTPVPRRATPPPPPAPPPATAPMASPSSASHVSTTADLAGILAGAGLPGVPVTTELTQKFGQILRVVVHGLMDVLRSRHQVKDEFRMRMTVVRPVDNNPLKLSANVDDALHNLLVKRNPAYLGPVESFQDAFDDLRRHQLAMLAGMRQAFEHALAEFDPERLQAEFDRQVRKSSVFPIGGKLRYWDLYRDRQQELARDPEATFRRLFGDAFTQAYEEQMKRLKDEQGRG